MNKINNCPFCKKGIGELRRYGSYFCRVHCTNCGAMGPPVKIENGKKAFAEQKAIKLWNGRK